MSCLCHLPIEKCLHASVREVHHGGTFPKAILSLLEMRAAAIAEKTAHGRCRKTPSSVRIPKYPCNNGPSDHARSACAESRELLQLHLKDLRARERAVHAQLAALNEDPGDDWQDS